MTTLTLQEQVTEMVAEALSLRYDFEMPPVSAAPQEWLEALLAARRRQDRVEDLLGRCLRAKFQLRRNKDAADAVAELAWDTHANEQFTSPVRMEFVSAKEKASSANLASLEQRRAARNAQVAYSHVEEAYESIKVTHWGLEGIRKDIHAALRAVSFESSLER